MPLRSFTPPLAAYWATWVLPTSITSGASLEASAAVIFWPIPFHSWIWILASMVGFLASKSFSKSFWKASETLSRISHTSMVVRPPPPLPFPSPLSSLPPHALSEAATASAAAPARRRAVFMTQPFQTHTEMTNWKGDQLLMEQGGMDQ